MQTKENRVAIRPLVWSDYGQWREAGERSCPDINAWRAYPRNFAISRPAFMRLCRRYKRLSKRRQRYHFGVFQRERFCGEVYADVSRRFPLTCHAGYWIDSRSTGRGLATRAMTELINEAFNRLGLRRIQLEIWPGHHASIRVAQRLGFIREGKARQLTFKDGVGYDYEIYALTIRDGPTLARQRP